MEEDIIFKKDANISFQYRIIFNNTKKHRYTFEDIKKLDEAFDDSFEKEIPVDTFLSNSSDPTLIILSKENIQFDFHQTWVNITIRNWQYKDEYDYKQCIKDFLERLDHSKIINKGYNYKGDLIKKIIIEMQISKQKPHTDYNTYLFNRYFNYQIRLKKDGQIIKKDQDLFRKFYTEMVFNDITDDDKIIGQIKTKIFSHFNNEKQERNLSLHLIYTKQVDMNLTYLGADIIEITRRVKQILVDFFQTEGLHLFGIEIIKYSEDEDEYEEGEWES